MSKQVPEQERVLSFRGGVLPPLEKLLDNTIAARKILTGGAVMQIRDAKARAQLAEMVPFLDNRLKDFERLYNESLMNLSSGPFESAVKRTFGHEFPQGNLEKDRQKRSYIELKITAGALRFFTMNGIEIVRQLKERLDTLPDEGSINKFKEQFDKNRIGANLYLLESASMVCARMARLLRVRHETASNHGVTLDCEYRAAGNYHIGEIFRSEFDPPNGHALPVPADFTPAAGEAEAEEQTKNQAKTQSATPASGLGTGGPRPAGAGIIKNGQYDTRGGADWNRTVHFTLPVDEHKANLDARQLQNCIHAETHLGAQEAAARSAVIRRFISQNRLKDFTADYQRFLDTFFDFLANSAIMNLGLSPDYKVPFLYFTGPSVFGQAALRFINKSKTGHIHYPKPNSRNRVNRYLPLQYINLRLSRWWEREIMKHIAAGRDNRALYNKISGMINQSYAQAMRRVKPQIDSIMNDQHGHSRDEAKAQVRKYLNDEIGIVNMAVYKRFRNEAVLAG